jgi:hypothetical protein
MEAVVTVLIVASALFTGAYVIDRFGGRSLATLERWMLRF